MPLSGKTLTSGRKVVAAAGTPEALVAVPTEAIYTVIAAETNNTGMVVIGGTDVDETLATRTGIPLNPGEMSPVLPVDDLVEVYIDVNVSGDGVTFIYLSPS